jgi:hypothetical protein
MTKVTPAETPQERELLIDLIQTNVLKLAIIDGGGQPLDNKTPHELLVAISNASEMLRQ